MANTDNTESNVQNAFTTALDIMGSGGGIGSAVVKKFISTGGPSTNHEKCCNLWENVEDRPIECRKDRFSNTDSGGSTVMAVNIAISIFALYLYKKCNKTGFNAGELCWACCCPLCYIFYKMAFDNCL